MRGINRILTGSAKAHFKKEEYIDTMRRLLKLGNKLVGAHVPVLEMRDIEHSLCETDKYLRALHGEGRPKQLYRVHL
jgi:hypothetical protein